MSIDSELKIGSNPFSLKESTRSEKSTVMDLSRVNYGRRGRRRFKTGGLQLSAFPRPGY